MEPQTESKYLLRGEITNIQLLPPTEVEEIFAKLSLADVSTLGRTCRLFRDAARAVLGSALRKLLKNVDRDLERINAILAPLARPCFACAFQRAAFLMCRSSLTALSVSCLRRTLDGGFCFPAGGLLDDLADALRSVRRGDITDAVERQVSAGIFRRTLRFLDQFEETGEDVGLHIVDLLDCSQHSNYEVTLTQRVGSGGSELRGTEHELRGSYELRDFDKIMMHPIVDASADPDVQIAQIVRYLRQHILCSNMWHEVRLFEEVESEAIKLFGQFVYSHNHDRPTPRTVRGTADARPAAVETVGPRPDDRRAETNGHTFARHRNDFETKFGMVCEVTLRSGGLPTCVEAATRNEIETENSDLTSASELDDVSQTDSSSSECRATSDDSLKNSTGIEKQTSISDCSSSKLQSQRTQGYQSEHVTRTTLELGLRPTQAAEDSKISVSTPQEQDQKRGAKTVDESKPTFQYESLDAQHRTSALHHVTQHPTTSLQSENPRQKNPPDNRQTEHSPELAKKSPDRPVNTPSPTSTDDGCRFVMDLRITCPSPWRDKAICRSKILVRISEEGTQVIMHGLDEDILEE